MHLSLASSRRIPVIASLGAVVAAGALWLGSAGVPCWAQASVPVAAASSPAPPTSAAVRRNGVTKPASAARANGRQPTTPLWTELTQAQRQALAPLAPKWDTVSEAQKRECAALSQNYPRMSAAEQELLHSRMTESAALSPQQRTQARLNFGEAEQISPDDNKSQVGGLQTALPPRTGAGLAAGAPARRPWRRPQPVTADGWRRSRRPSAWSGAADAIAAGPPGRQTPCCRNPAPTGPN